ncbi:hypothetical protein BDV93DRAFT_608235 [Ceratobasidium sp. AG-I]|nr:hypothetical protein BDV93DRAFT_608235 [Ceratobasidium sp. AG-I]
MSAHRRTTSDTVAAPVFVPHDLTFAGGPEDNDNYYAAQRYDWDNVPAKLTEPRAAYEPTQPFDYVLPKRQRKAQARALSVSNGDTGPTSAAEAVVKRRVGRPRRDEENSPAVSVEPELLSRSAPKKRGRPRRSEASRKTDDGDNTEDESYVQPSESWKAGTKRRGHVSQHMPTKRARTSRTVDSDDDQETAPLRSGGARSRVTPVKPQQANRWSSTEDRQLIDSLFEVLGSIPWRRVTLYMAERGYPCADRGEGAIRGRWKVLRPRLYIVPPPVVRGAAAKSQLKAREREETAARGETLEADGEEHEHEQEQDQEDEEMDVANKSLPEPDTTMNETMSVDVEGLGGETTADDEEVVARAAASKRRKRVPPTPEPNPEAVEVPDIGVPPSSAQRYLPQLQDANGRSPGQSSIGLPASGHSTKTYKVPEPQIVSSQPPAQYSLAHVSTPGQHEVPLPPNLPVHFTPPTQPAHHTSSNMHQAPHYISPNIQHQTPPNQPLYLSSPNATHRSPQNALRDPKELRSYTHLPVHYAPPSRLDDHGGQSPVIGVGQTLPVPLVVGQSPSRATPSGHGQVPTRVDQQQVLLHQQPSPRSSHKHTSGGRALPSLASQVPSSTSAQSHERAHLPSYPTQPSYSPSHLSLPLPHSTVSDTRHLPTPQSYAPRAEHVWPARPAAYDSSTADRTYESGGELSAERSGRREFQTSGERDYQVSGERERAYVSRSREERAYISLEDRPYVPSSQREERVLSGAFTSHEERAHASREERGHDRGSGGGSGRYESREREREGERERKSRKPEMLPFPLPHEQRSVRRSRDTAATSTFQPSALYPSYQTPSSQPSYQSQQTSTYQTSPTFQASPSFTSPQVFPPTHRYAQASSLFTPQEPVAREPGQSRLPVLGERTPPTRTELSPRRGHDTSPRRTQDESPRKRRPFDGSPTRRGQSSSQGLSEVPDSTAGDSDSGR